MVLANRTTAELIARRLAETVRGCESADSLWVRVYRNVVELWLVTKSIDIDQERYFYEASQALYDEFPAAQITFHLVNPEMFEPFVLRQIVPAGAEPHPLR